MAARWRVVDTGPADPFTNMALDEALLRSYSAGRSGPTLRIYGWQPAALSLGYSQQIERELDLGFCARKGLPVVRRITGGGIIHHHDEITYSLAASREDLGISGQVVSSYKTIAVFLIEFYKRLGLKAGFACDLSAGEKLGEPSALCYSSKEKYDIVVAGRKIGGSAQKRSRELMFQHGSIPVGASTPASFSFLRDKKAAVAAKTASLGELLGRTPGMEELSRILMESFASTFGIELAPGKLFAHEMEMMAELRERKYKSREWNFNRVDNTAENNLRGLQVEYTGITSEVR